jgi:hypothetical protein
MTPGTYVARMRALTKSVTERNARIRPRTITEARPGDTVRFECSDCDEIYRQTIIPRRDVARALVRLSEGEAARAAELLHEALEGLRRIAEFMDERDKREWPVE